MKNLSIFIVIAVLLSPVFISADEMKEDEELLTEFLKHNIGVNPLSKKYIFNKIYLGMDEKEFVEIYTWNETFSNTYTPYITSKNDNVYYLHLPYIKLYKKLLSQTPRANITSSGKVKVTFVDGKLNKFEMQYRDKFPFMFLVYGDRTYMLEKERRTEENNE